MSTPVPPAGGTGSGRSRTTWIIGGVIALVVVIAAVVAIASSGGDDETGGAAPGAVDGGPAGAGAEGGSSPLPAASGGAEGGSAGAETRPVTVSGDALAPFGDGDDGAVGATIPTLTGQSFDGSPVTIAPGAPTLVAFLAHWCPHCQAEVPRLVEWDAAGQVPAGVEVVAVSTAVAPDRDNFPPSEWLAGEGWPWPVLADDADSTAGRAFGLQSFPYFVFYDADGTVLFRESGELGMEELTTLIDEALAR